MSQPLCVVVDTSVWRSEVGLRSVAAKTLLYTLSRRHGFLGLPEVVDSELSHQIAQAAEEESAKLRSPSNWFQTFFDGGWGCAIPENLRDRVSLAFQKHIDSLAPLLLRDPLTMAQVRSALSMVNAKVPPNDKHQQFKDSLIWQSVLGLAARHELHFVVNDAAFFEGKNPKNRLAQNLIDDCARNGVEVNAYGSLRDCLGMIAEGEPNLNTGLVLSLILPEVVQKLEADSTVSNWVLGKLARQEITGFKTDEANRVAVDYRLSFKARSHADGLGRTVHVHGSCYFDPSGPRTLEHHVQNVTILWKSGAVTRSFRDYYAGAPIPRPLPFPQQLPILDPDEE